MIRLLHAFANYENQNSSVFFHCGLCNYRFVVDCNYSHMNKSLWLPLVTVIQLLQPKQIHCATAKIFVESFTRCYTIDFKPERKWPKCGQPFKTGPKQYQCIPWRV